MEKNRWNIPITWNDFRKVWLMTKFVIIFLFMMSMNVSANLYSQTKTVSIKMERGSLGDYSSPEKTDGVWFFLQH
jgi:hypothetical protein